MISSIILDSGSVVLFNSNAVSEQLNTAFRQADRVVLFAVFIKIRAWKSCLMPHSSMRVVFPRLFSMQTRAANNWRIFRDML